MPVRQKFFLDGTPLPLLVSKRSFKHWMSIFLVCVMVNGAKIFVKNGSLALRERVFSAATGPRENQEKLQKHWMFWESHFPLLLNTLSIEDEALIKGRIDVRLYKQKNYGLRNRPNKHTLSRLS